MKFKIGMFCFISLFCILFLNTGAAAWEDADVVGNVPLLLRAETEDMTASSGQVSLGSAAADAALEVSGADAALIPAADIKQNLLAGETTWEEITKSVADSTLVIVSVTPSQLYAYLETGLSALVLDEETKAIDYAASAWDGFLQVGGIEYRADLSAVPGERVLSVTMAQEELDPEDEETQILLVMTLEMMNGAFGYPVSEGTVLEETLQSALAALIESGTLTQDYDWDGRCTLIGHTGNSLAGEFHLGLIAVIGILIVLFSVRSETEFMERMRTRYQADDADDETGMQDAGSGT